MSKNKHKNRNRQHQPSSHVKVILPIDKPKVVDMSGFHIANLCIEQCLMLSNRAFDRINDMSNDASAQQAVQFLMEAGALREKLQELDVQLLVQTSKLNQTYLVAKG